MNPSYEKTQNNDKRKGSRVLSEIYKNLREQNKKLLEDKKVITQRIKNRRELIADLRKELKAIKTGKPYSVELFGVKSQRRYVRIKL